jgi:hypothetical protein
MTNPFPSLPRDQRKLDADHLNPLASFHFVGAVPGGTGDFKLQISDLKWVAWDLELEIADLKWGRRVVGGRFEITNYRIELAAADFTLQISDLKRAARGFQITNFRFEMGGLGFEIGNCRFEMGGWTVGGCHCG